MDLEDDEITGPTTGLYGPCHNDLHYFGVMIRLISESEKPVYTNKQMNAILAGYLLPYRNPPVGQDDGKITQKTPRRRERPYFRRLSFSKGIVFFDRWYQANDFANRRFDLFITFIPLIFVCVPGIVELEMNEEPTEELELDPSYEIARCFTKVKNDKKYLILFVRGTNLPAHVIDVFGKKEVKRMQRAPIRCETCLRYGHRTSNCMRKPRCGVCSKTAPFDWHQEMSCSVITNGEAPKCCIFCLGNHSIGHEKCDEHHKQRALKNSLASFHMDFINFLIGDAIPKVRKTEVNSSFAFLR